MIARLKGRIEEIAADHCIVDVNGVGYLVHASTRSLSQFPMGAAATVLVEMQVREDAITLFGFADTAERDWFRLLMTVQGVGAKVALSILSTLGPGDLAAAIGRADAGILSRPAGVGKKLAARLITELRDRVGAMPAGGGVMLAATVLPAGGAAADAASALINLGYRRAEAEAAVNRAIGRVGDDASVDLLIREGLKELAR